MLVSGNSSSVLCRALMAQLVVTLKNETPHRVAEPIAIRQGRLENDYDSSRWVGFPKRTIGVGLSWGHLFTFRLSPFACE